MTTHAALTPIAYGSLSGRRTGDGELDIAQVWDHCAPADAAHPFLAAHRLPPLDLRQAGTCLVAPLRDRSGTLAGLMLVDPSGATDCWPRLAAADAAWCLGEPNPMAIITCGSLADAMAIHVATRMQIFHVDDHAHAKRLRLHLLAQRPGLTVSIAESSAVRASSAAPMGAVADHMIAPPSGYGWARLRLTRGDAAIRSWIDDPLIVAGGVEPAPFFVIRRSGVWSIATESGLPMRISGPVLPLALMHDEKRDGWARVVWLRDRDGAEQIIAISEAQIALSPRQVMAKLINAGLEVVGPEVSSLLIAHLAQTAVAQRFVAVERPGWHGAHYVHPAGTIGQGDGERPVRAGSFALAPDPSAEAIRCWSREIGTLADGNSRLVLGICAAFGGLAIGLLPNQGSFGVHIRGMSSTGKTTSLAVGASIHGPASQEIASWRATDAGLEAMAAEHHNRCLFLDEIAQLDPKAAAVAAYTLGNGQGRNRAKGTGRAARIQTWQLTVLSSGEIALEDKIAEWSGAPAMREGQDVRFIDIPADAGKGAGIFDALHNFADGASLSEHLKAEVEQATGDVALSYLHHLAQDPEAARRMLMEWRDAFIAAHLPGDADGIVRRVFGNLGFLAAAGELAIHYGILPWSSGSATANIAVCAHAWHAARTERRPRTPEVIVREWLLEHQKSLAAWEGETAEDPTFGYVRHRPHVFYLLSDGWRALCHGHDARSLSSHLKAAGLLRYTCARRPGAKPQRFYVIDGIILNR